MKVEPICVVLTFYYYVKVILKLTEYSIFKVHHVNEKILVPLLKFRCFVMIILRMIKELVALLQSYFVYPSLVLVQPRKTRPCLTERLLMGRK